MNTSPTIKVKICGMRDPANITAVAALQPAYLGFIFYKPSPRFVGDQFVMPALPAGIQRVGVFVNETTDAIVDKVARYELDAVQLHGNETPEQAAALKEHGVAVMKVFSIGDAFDWSTTTPYANVADYFLFDTKGKYYGGNAQTFDWRLLQGYNQKLPFFLSGGLTPDNLVDIEALKDMNLYALDLNSGLEDSPGVKNLELVKKAIDFVDKSTRNSKLETRN